MNQFFTMTIAGGILLGFLSVLFDTFTNPKENSHPVQVLFYNTPEENERIAKASLRHSRLRSLLENVVAVLLILLLWWLYL